MIDQVNGLPDGWQIVTLGEIASVIGGGTPKTKELDNYDGGTIPWITPADLSGYANKYIEHGKRFITKKGLNESSARIMPAGTILFTSRAPIGYVAISKNELCTNQGFKSFVIKNKNIALSDYVYWWLKGSKNLAESNASGTTFLELSGTKAKQLPIPIAPLPEQHRIVAEIEKQFSRLDEAVAGLKRIQSNLKRYRASVLKAAVEGKLTAEWRKQHSDTEPAEQLLQRILKERRAHWEQAELEKMQAAGKPPKDDQWKQKFKEPVAPDVSGLPALPEGWVWACVEQVFRSVTDGDHQPPPKSKTGIPFLVIGNVASGKLDFTNTRFVESSYYEALTDSRTINEGDILYTVVGSFGIPVKVNTTKKFCVQRHIAILKPNDHIVSDYLFQGLKSNLFYKQASDVATGTAQKTVSLGGLRNIKLPLPPLAEQFQIVSEVERRLSIADEVEQQINTNLKRAERMRQSILKKAFSGRLVQQDPNDEPAGVLLEKIKQAQCG